MSDLLVRTVDSDCYIKTSKAGPFHSNRETYSVISKQVSLNRCPRRTDNSVRLFEKDVTEWLPFPTRNSALSVQQETKSCCPFEPWILRVTAKEVRPSLSSHPNCELCIGVFYIDFGSLSGFLWASKFPSLSITL